METLYDWMSVAKEIRSFYKCPENCCLCCRSGYFPFFDKEYRQVLATVKPEKRAALEAIVVDESEEKIARDMIDFNIPRSTINELVQRVGVKHFTTDICPLLEGNKCSVESVKFSACRTYPFQADEVYRDGTIDIIPCPVGLDIIYDFAGMLFYIKHIGSGSLKSAPMWKDDLQVILNCYNDRLTPDCEEPIHKIVWRFSTHILALQQYLKVISRPPFMSIIHKVGLVVKQTIESCAGMQEVDEKAIEDLIEKVGRIVAVSEDESHNADTSQKQREIPTLEELERQSAYKLLKDVIFQFPLNEDTFAYHADSLFSEISKIKDESVNFENHFNKIAFHTILNRFDVVSWDTKLDPAVLDTIIKKKQIVKTLKIPYKAFFINRCFPIDNNRFLLGFAVYDVAFIGEWLLSQKKWLKSIMKRHANFTDAYFDAMCTFIDEAVKYLKDKDMFKRTIVTAYVLRFETDKEYISNFSVNLGTLIQGFGEKKPHLPFDIEDDVIKYLYNVCFLILNRNRKKASETRKSTRKEVDILDGIKIKTYYPDKKAEIPRDKRFTYITVFGDVEKYLEEYNKQRTLIRRGKITGIVEVCGHHRHFHSPRFRQELRDDPTGKWIAPHTRGEDTGELQPQRFVKIIHGKGGKNYDNDN